MMAYQKILKNVIDITPINHPNLEQKLGSQ